MVRLIVDVVAYDDRLLDMAPWMLGEGAGRANPPQDMERWRLNSIRDNLVEVVIQQARS
jgi:hypothetical protein